MPGLGGDALNPSTNGRGAPDAFKINGALDRPDHLLQLTPVDPAPLLEAVDQIIEEQGIELEYIDRFGRRRSGSD